SSGPTADRSTRLQSVSAPATNGPLVPSASELCELVCRSGVSQAPSAFSGPTPTDSTGRAPTSNVGIVCALRSTVTGLCDGYLNTSTDAGSLMIELRSRMSDG